MSKKFRLLMVLVLITGLFGGLLTGSTVSADPTPGTFIEIPRIDVGDGWETQIQIQNLGAAVTVDVDFYGGDYEVCSGADGVMASASMWLPVGGVWTLHNAIPAGARSAFITSDELLAVTVDRWGPDPFGEFEISSSYTGIADDGRMVGPGPPYEYFAPYVMHGYNDLDTVITIQNSGDMCVSIWIYYKEEGNCEFMKAQHVEQIAPGEAIRIGPGEDMEFPSPEIDPPWLGSAYVTANAPLAIVVDQLSITGANQATLLTMRGFPYKQEFEKNWYADLLYREISGWSSSIQVQNLTQGSMPTFVTVEFFDQSGDSILFVGDWICRNGANTFYLPAIIDLGVNYPFGYVGAAEIQSHGQVDYPGGWHDGEPIFAVVDIKKTKVYDMGTGMWRHTVKGETQAGAYNAHPEIQKTGAWAWAMPYIAKEQNGVTSRIALRNNANCNKITGVIVIHDETGRAVTTIPVPWLHPKHMKIVDLAYFGQIARGFVGAAKFFVTGVEQLCDTNNDGITDQLPVMPSIVVLNYGFATELPIGSGAGPLTDKGDLTRVYEAFPIYYRDEVCEGSLFGTATVRNADHGYDFPYLRDVEVWINGEDTGVKSDSTGGYQVRPVDEGASVVTFKKSGELEGGDELNGGVQGGFFDLDMDAEVECGKATKLDPELICANPLFVTVEDMSGNAIPGATVTAEVTFEVNGEGDETYTTTGGTDNAGMAEFDVAGAGDVDLEVTAAGHDPLEFDGQPEVPHHGGESENEDCRDTLYAGVELCKYNTVVGTVWIGLLPAEGYTLELVDMSVDPPAVVDTDVTTLLGVYSLEGLSAAHGTYRINLYNAGGTFISTTGDFDVDANCGDTGMISYYSGNWGGSGFE